jgi:predicted glycosyltransferase
MTVMFYVQHLLGIGHIMRAASIIRGMRRLGLEVTVVSGGEPVPVLNVGDADFVQLPSARATDRSFKVLIDETGQVVDEAWRAGRRNMLLEVLSRVRPRVLMFELFPFGRRQFRFEILPLIEAARAMQPRPKIVSSVRDILVIKDKPERNDEMIEMAETYFDAVLIHGDPDFVTLGVTFPYARRLEGMLRYTGYVVDEDRLAGASGEAGAGEVIVSAGGGGVGFSLLQAAIEARAATSLHDTTWRLLAGFNLPEDRFGDLKRSLPEGIITERARADFFTLLSNCRASISQGGYNTVMEVLASGAPSVIVPYAGLEESEQTLRAKLLEKRSLVQVVEEKTLSPETLTAALEAALVRPRPAGAGLDMGGTEASARIIAELAQAG